MIVNRMYIYKGGLSDRYDRSRKQNMACRGMFYAVRQCDNNQWNSDVG